MTPVLDLQLIELACTSESPVVSSGRSPARPMCKQSHQAVDNPLCSACLSNPFGCCCRRLLGDLTGIVSDRKASGRDVATAVRGIGQLAAPTLKFFGQEVRIYVRSVSPEAPGPTVCWR